MNRLRALAAAAAILVTGLQWAGTGRAAAATPSGSGPSVQFVSQTSWLQGPGLFHFGVGLPGAAPDDRVEVKVYYQVRTRTAFQQDASGKVGDGWFYDQAASVSALKSSKGVFDLALPVDVSPPSGDPYGRAPIGNTGVFPVQIGLADSQGRPIGDPLTTFIVYVQPTLSAGKITPLDAAVIIPVGSAPMVSPTGGLAPPPPAEVARLDGLASELNGDTKVHASVVASPLTMDELAAGSTPADKATYQDLAGFAVGSPLQLMPVPYSPLSIGDLEAASPSELAEQLRTGAQKSQALFGAAPDQSTWAVDGPLDPATLSVLLTHHVTQLVVPDGDLSSYPSQITFAGSTYLNWDGFQIKVVAADPGLTSDFIRSGPPALAANVLLAEMAMIYTEAPNPIDPRGVVVMPPAGWAASQAFVGTLLRGLQGNPLVVGVAASSLFSALHSTEGTRFLAANQSSGPGYSPNIANRFGPARAAIDDLSAVLGASTQVSTLKEQLLLAESEPLTDGQRNRILDSISRVTDQIDRAVTLPPATSITLTSTQGVVPITILTQGNIHPRVELRMSSPRLIFRPFAPRNGTCRVESKIVEVCTLTLEAHNTTLRVPVETRSSGVFPLDVTLFPPGGTRPLLPTRQDTVRSTAVSSVAIILIIAALVALVLWWGRDLRRGRRPKGMVPSPVAEPDGRGRVGDPDVDAFFDRPPPEFGAMSPSGGPAGPSTTTETYGRMGRETGD